MLTERAGCGLLSRIETSTQSHGGGPGGSPGSTWCPGHTCRTISAPSTARCGSTFATRSTIRGRVH